MQITPDILDRMSDADREEVMRLLAITSPMQEDWRDWLTQRFPHTAQWDFAPHHAEAWEWIQALQQGVKPKPLIRCWARGGGKSTTVEHGVGYVCDHLTRRYALYVCGTQDKADDHVSAVASLIERMGVGRAVNKYGHSRGWRRQQLRAANGFNVAGFGLDTGLRGAKLDEYRPDWIILDDVDEVTDSLLTIEKKIQVITSSILPAGSVDCAVSFVQNAIHRESIMSRLIDGRADFLRDRSPVVAVPALYNMDYTETDEGKFVITAGEPSWSGQSVETCQAQMNEWGESAFLREAQHEVYTASKFAYFKTPLLSQWLQEVRSGRHTPLDWRDWPRDLTRTFQCAQEGTLRFWELPRERKRYLVTCDPAEGLSTDEQLDYCALHVIDDATYAQVCSMYGRWETHVMAAIVDEIARFYSPALIGVLSNNHGNAVLSHLLETYGWPARRGDRFGGVYYYDSSELFGQSKEDSALTMKPGYPENVKTKPFMLDALARAISDEAILIRDEQTLMELLTYVHLPGGKSGADTGAHDDAVSALALAAVLLMLKTERKAKGAEDTFRPQKPQTSGVVWGRGR